MSLVPEGLEVSHVVVPVLQAVEPVCVLLLHSRQMSLDI